MKTTFLAILLLCGSCIAAEPLPAKAFSERTRVLAELRRNVEKLSEQDMATLKTIVAKYATAKPKAPAPAKAAPAPPAKKK
jgi:hypothetical protein